MISLDFELSWGMRDRGPLSPPLRRELLRSRDLMTEIADELCARSVRATWATVGFLFASTRDELRSFSPAVRPRYLRHGLDPYAEEVGEDEEADPLHLAGSIVRSLARREGQEIASHTFSHYYCLEPGQDEGAWRADLASATAIARHVGVELSSLVLARNQWNPAYRKAVAESGFTSYRGPQPSWGHRPAAAGRRTHLRRAARLADTYVGPLGPPTSSWDELEFRDGLCNIAASAFLRPFDPRLAAVEPLRERRLDRALSHAARRTRIFHLWWHPHNFAAHPRQSFDLLRRFLDRFAELSETEGMRSLSMGDVAALLSARSA